MYERFTDTARKVMQQANQEAQRFNHEYIGAEHLLLGLIKTACVAETVLKRLGVDLRKIRLEVEKIIKPGPDMVMLGRLPHTPAMKRVLENTIVISHEFNHNYVGTEHMLLALTREEDGVVVQVLRSLGLTPEKIRNESLSVMWAQTKEKVPAQPIPEPTLPQPKIIYVPPDNAAAVVSTQANTIQKLTEMLAQAHKELDHLRAEIGVDSCILKAAEDNHAKELSDAWNAERVTDREAHVLCSVFRKFQAILKERPAHFGDLEHTAKWYLVELSEMYDRFTGENEDE
jgi:ATP-dependent Clp protease ATP-binding subunit ClpA